MWSVVVLCYCAYTHRFVSEFQPNFRKLEYSVMDRNISEAMDKIEAVARPLVGLRSKQNEYWWPYPLLTVYMAIDTTLDGKRGE